METYRTLTRRPEMEIASHIFSSHILMKLLTYAFRIANYVLPNAF